MADAENGLDLLLALADEPNGCTNADFNATGTKAPHGAPPAHEPTEHASEDELDILCRLADEAEASLIPGSPGAGDVPFDAVDEVAASDQQPQQSGGSGSPASQQTGSRQAAGTAAQLKRRAEAAAAGVQPQDAGRTAFLGIKTGKFSSAAASGGTGWVEKRTGLRVKHPKYSSVVLQERLSEVAYISIGSLTKAAGMETPWATVGVLSEKLPVRAASTGKAYSLWVLSDLNGASVKVLLFGDAHDAHWQLSQGSLLAAWGGKVWVEGGQPSLTLSSPEQLTHVGTAADFGTCRSTRKDGTPCTAGVNVAKCPFCEYHVAKEYRKMAPRRGGFTDSLLPTGFRRSGTAAQPGGRKMVAANMAGAAAPRAVRQHSAADMAAIASRDVGRRNGMGRKYMMSQAEAVAEHGGRPGPPPQQLYASYPQQHASGRAQPGSGGGNAAARPAHSGRLHSRGAADSASSQSRHNGSGNRPSGGGDRSGGTHGALGVPSPVLPASAAAPSATGGKRKAPATVSEGRTAGQQPKADGDFMELEAEAALEEDEGMWQRRQQQRQQPRQHLQQQQTQRRQQQQLERQNHTESELQQQEQQQAQCQQNQQRQSQQGQQQRHRQPSASYLKAVAVVREAGGVAAAMQASKRARTSSSAATQPTGHLGSAASGAVPSARRGDGGARPQLNPNLPQLKKPSGPGGMRYDMRTGPATHAAAAAAKGAMRAPLATRLNAAEAGRSIAAVAAERAKAQKRAAGGAPAKASFAAAFTGIGDDEAQPSKSRYQHVADQEAEEELDKVMGTLERKDATAARMDDIRVKAWHCAACGYTAEAPAKACRDAGHELARLSATKRWWRCNACGHHFSTVAVRYPASRCPKCDSSEPSFKAASMLRGAKGPEELSFASRDRFQARGTEHGFCLKS